MTIQMEIGLRRLHTLPSLTRKENWDGRLSGKELSVTPELVDLDGLNLRYTSLRDLISPTSLKRGSSRGGEVDWCDISQVTFKDRLVKQAARAYLQPMVIKNNQEIHFLTFCWTKLRSHGSLVSGLKEYVQAPIKLCFGNFARQVYSKLSLAFEVVTERFRFQLSGLLRLRARH